MTNLTKASETAQPEETSSFSLDVERRGIRDSIVEYFGRLRTGEPGALPSVLGLVVLAVIFSQVSSRFLSRNNVGNLPGQGAYIAIIGLGLVFVLLLGEIDLSAGTTGGMCAGFAGQAIFSKNLHKAISGGLFWSLIVALVAAILLALWLKAYTGAVVVAIGLVIVATNLTQHVVWALLAAVALGAAVGILNGWLVAKVGIPSFIVTLALFLAWQGVLLFAVNSQPIGTTNYSFWYGLTSDNLTPAWSWVFTIVVIGGYLVYTLLKSVTAHRRGLAADTLSLVLFRGGVLAAIGIVITVLANQNRATNSFVKNQGLPWAAVIPVTLMIVCTIALTKTSWGRHLYATGGNAEAAHRAGIDVVHIKVTAFTICSAFGALGGVFLASNSHSVSLDLGAGNILLFSVAAAVIGGTSLFGGRGKPRDAIIGALVIVIIPNGLGLKPSLPPQNQQIITGAVLLVAAAVDAMTRRRSRIR
ncbi:MAG: D-xylose transport system permease protein [Micromonosporaceae bacterium]|jgi:D-xylose transport system permease protein|nr:D-xylose transport system permease protein [Micromonosporaceae bacterium]